MITLTINGRSISVEPGTTLIKAADAAGIEIPRFCWHPSLSVAGNCRMCLVKIEKNPKLQIACNTAAAEGMVVSTDSPEVREAVRGVLEFMLINHPLDCPVCDQAGECGLQDYYMKVGVYKSRFGEKKVRKGKVLPLGRGIMLDQERCILCSRCIRFMREIAKSEELAFFHRGTHVELGTAPGKNLQSPYSGNIVDLCPVGALTSVDFRFKCRAWFLADTASVCPGCATGCNISIHHAKYHSQTLSSNLYRSAAEVPDQVILPHLPETIFRLRPRRNDSINTVWMCDEGRLAYKHVHADTRLLQPLVRGESGAEVRTWSDAMEALTSRLSAVINAGAGKSIAGIGSPWASNGENAALRKFIADVLSSERLAPWAGQPVTGPADDILMSADKSPNRKGAEAALGVRAWDAVLSGAKALFLMDQDPYGRWAVPAPLAEAARRMDLVVVLGTNVTEATRLAHIALPIPAFAEQSGDFTTGAGVVQPFQKAFAPAGGALGVHEIFSRLSRRLGYAY